jgi:hypothetical protein
VSEWPTVTIALTTYYARAHASRRWQAAKVAIASWKWYLRYEGELRVHWADDGSDDPDTLAAVTGLLRQLGWEGIQTCQQRRGLGAGLNAVFAAADGPVLYAADDWELLMPFDLTPWVRLLGAYPRWNVGAVRLGMLHPGVTGAMEMGPGCWFLRLEPHNVVCGLLRPSLIGAQFLAAYGLFPEGMSPLAMERIQNDHYCTVQKTGSELPQIVLGLTEPWQHLESVSLNLIQPGG